MENTENVPLPTGPDVHDHHLLEQHNTTEAVKSLLPAAEGTLLKHHETNEKLDKIHQELVKSNEGPRVSEMNGAAEMIMKAAKGDPGKTPEKGVDYFTEDEKNELIKEILPQVTPLAGKDFYTDEEKENMADDVFGRMRVPNDGADGQNGTDGEDADDEAIEQRITQKVLALIPQAKEVALLVPRPQDGKDGSPDTPQQVRDKLYSLEGDDVFDYERLRNRPDIVALIRSHISSKDYSVRELTDVSMQGIVAGQLLQFDGQRFIPYTPLSGSGNSSFGEVPSGSGTTFTLAHTPLVGTVRLYRGGAYQQAGSGNDYTISGANITLSLALAVGEVLLADYNY